ncbi:MAG: tetratricopeptide repeat protein [Firmicutes bacterium]|nr:tetratricopeptide repeat protein [Bacillota bacterium]
MRTAFVKSLELLHKKKQIIIFMLVCFFVVFGILAVSEKMNGISVSGNSGNSGNSAGKNENTTLTAGINMLEKQDYAQAGRLFDESLKKDPDSYLAYYGKGRIDFRNSEFDSAKKYFEKSVSINPDFAPAQMWLGKVYHFRKDFHKAMEYYNKAVALDPGYADAYCHMGYAQYYLDNEEAAIKYLDKCIELNPKHSVAYFGKARILNEKEDFKNAEACFTMAVQNDPMYAEAYQQRGILYAGELKYKNALEDLNKALKLEPDNISSLHERGTIYFWSGNYKEALRDFDLAQKLYCKPDGRKTDKDLTGYLNLEKGLSLYRMGEKAQGQDYIKKGLKTIKPSDEDEDWDLIGYGYMALGENDTAFNYFNKYKEGDLHHALYGRAVIYLGRGQKDKARKDLEESVGIMPDTWVKRDSEMLLEKMGIK